jgi:hypothetical protein
VEEVAAAEKGSRAVQMLSDEKMAVVEGSSGLS